MNTAIHCKICVHHQVTRDLCRSWKLAIEAGWLEVGAEASSAHNDLSFPPADSAAVEEQCCYNMDEVYGSIPMVKISSSITE
jgi:hypothetical protein